MLRLLVVAEDPARERDMVWRAEAALEELSSVPEVEIVVSPRTDGLLDVARLDAWLFTRPLPDRLIVVGRHPSCTPKELAFLDTMLDLRPDLSAVVAAETSGPGVDALLAHGGIFRGGPLCQVGGFAGDGRRPVRARIEASGFRCSLLSDRPMMADGGLSRGMHPVPA
ncbi:MAG TPA: hypothetical protein VLR27_00090 [Acidimicrobiales bacterium]|nr:hypothetical protein [Acidimicrobiales bacterium]